MQSKPGSFWWSEDFNEALNYWFWFRRIEDIAEEELAQRIRESIRLGLPDQYLAVELESGWTEFLPVWRDWKRDQVATQMSDSRSTPTAVGKQHYDEMAAIGLRSLRVEWVMARFGERWLFPPDVAILGWEGATAEERRAALLDAARAIRRSQRG
jgi:hypothetical protein